MFSHNVVGSTQSFIYESVLNLRVEIDLSFIIFLNMELYFSQLYDDHIADYKIKEL